MNPLDGTDSLGFFGRLLVALRSKWSLAAENDQLRHALELKMTEVDFLNEQLDAYRDTVQTFQVEQRLAGALHMADLKAITAAKKSHK